MAWQQTDSGYFSFGEETVVAEAHDDSGGAGNSARVQDQSFIASTENQIREGQDRGHPQVQDLAAAGEDRVGAPSYPGGCAC